MRRVASYGGPSGVPASQRLKHKLAETAGMRVFSDRLSQEQGFLAPLAEEEDGRVLHSTSWATRNFFATASSLKKFVKVSKFWGSSKEPVVLAEEDRGHGNGSSPLVDRAEISADDPPQLETNSRSVQGAEIDHMVDTVQRGIPQAEASDSQDIATWRTNHKRSASDPANLNLPSFSPNLNVHVQPNSWNDDMENLGVQRQVHHDMPYQGLDAGIQTLTVDPEPTILIGINESADSLESTPSIQVEIEPSVVSDHYVLRKACVTEASQGDPCSVQTQAPEVFMVEHFPKPAVRFAAALKIQSYYKQWCARKHYMSLRDKTRKLQAMYRGKRVLDEYRSLRSKVIVCQRVWRRHRSFWVHLSALAAEAAHLQSVRQKSATLIQSCWRAHVQKAAFLRLLEIAKAKNEAAYIIQRRWRRFQQLLAEEYTSVTKAQAATVIQAFVRGWSVRNMVAIQNRSAAIIQRKWTVHRNQVSTAAALKIQTWWRGYTKQLLDQGYYKRCRLAAIRLQCMWRTCVARQSLLYLQMERSVKEKAATRLQAHVRGHVVRRSVSKQHCAAAIIQRCWRNYWLKKHYNAAVIIQTWWRGSVARRCVPFLQSVSGQDQEIIGELDEESTGANSFSAVSGMGKQDVETGEDSHIRVAGTQRGTEQDLRSSIVIQRADVSSLEGMPTQCDKRQDNSSLDEDCSSVMKEVIVVNKPADRQLSSPICNTLLVVRAEVLEDEVVSELALCPSIDMGDHNGESCNKDKVTGGNMLSCHSAPLHEDWDDVRIDTLDECLDTCLAALKPFPAISSIEIDEKINQNAQALRANDSRDKLVCVGEKGEVCDQDIVSICSSRACAGAVSEAAQPGLLRCVSTDIEDRPSGNMAESEGAIRISSYQTGSKYHKQPSGIHKLNLQRNEERLQHFARVFLLQRQIAHQQLRAQSAPPFPPPHGMLVPDFDGQHVHLNGTTNSEESTPDQSSATGTIVFEDLAGLPGYCDSIPNLGGKDPHSPIDSQVASSNPGLRTGAASFEVYSSMKPTSERPEGIELPMVSAHSFEARTTGSDVVVNMAELLKQLDGVYGASKPHAEYLTSPVLLSKETVVYIGDEDDSYDKQRKGAFGTRRDSSMLTDVVGTKRLGIPDVNAMLVILVAMVVYTRTIFRSSFLWSKESQRK